MKPRWIIPLILAGGGLVAAPMAHRFRPLWILNTTASAPIGLYRLQPIHRLRVGQWVVVSPPPSLARDLAARGALPLGVPLVKQVAAIAPSSVCRFGADVSINRRAVAVARTHDRRGWPLPIWQGCQSLTLGQVFLLNPRPDSLDGRYFGPTDAGAIVGEARPLWIRGPSW